MKKIHQGQIIMNHNIIKLFYYENVFFFLLCRRVALQGSNAASGNSQNNSKQEDEDASLEVTPQMVVIFVILICGTLLLLFYFYNYLVYVVIVLFCLAACNGFYECMRPIVLWLPLGMNKVMLQVKFIIIIYAPYPKQGPRTSFQFWSCLLLFPLKL